MTLVLNMVGTFHVSSKENHNKPAQLGKFHDLKITMGYLHVEIVLELRTLIGQNMFYRRDEEQK